MPSPIAELFVSVGADVSQAINGLNAASNATTSLANQFKAAVPAALLLEGAAAGVGAVFVGAVKTAADFEAQMAGVRAVLSPVEVQQFGGALDALALTLGRDTTFTSRQAAAAIEELIKAGLPAQAVLDGAAAGALNLAAATGVTTADAATIAAQALNTFSLNAAQSTAVVDKLAGVANTSASDISFLRFGLASVGGVAAGLGLSFNDTADALGLLSKTFAGGSDAGTSLKTFLERLQPQTKAQREEFLKLGITTKDGGNAFFDAAGHVQSLANIAEVLHGSLSGMTDQQRQSALQTLFGTDAIRAALGLYAAGADGVHAFAEASGQQGIAAQSAKTRLDSLEGTLQNLGGSFEKVQIDIGKLFLPMLRDIANFAKNAVDAFGALSPETQRLAVFVTGGAAAFAGLIGGMVLLGAIIPPLMLSFGALGAILTGPVGLAIAAAVGVGALLFAAWQHDFGGIQGIVASMAERLGPILANLGLVAQKAFAGDFGGALDTLRAIVGAASPELGKLFTSVQGFASEAGPKMAEIFGAVAASLNEHVVPRIQELIPLLQDSLPKALESLGPIAATALSPITGTFDLITSHGDQLKTFFADVLPAALSEMATRLAPVLSLLGSTAAFFGAINNLIGTLVSVSGNVLAGLFNNVLVTGIQKLFDVFSSNQDTVKSVADNMAILAAPLELLGRGVGLIAGGFNAASDAINRFAGVLQQPLPDWITKPQFGAGTPPSGGAAVTPASFNPNVPIGGGGGNVIIQGDVNIGSEVDADNFLNRMAALLRGSAGRVNAPPDNSGIPALATGVI